MSENLMVTETGRTRVKYDAVEGFSIITQDAKSGGLRTLPIDPVSIDALIEQWPEFRKKAQSVVVEPVPPAMPSPSTSKDGRTATNSPSFPPRRDTTASGTGGSSGPTAKGSGAGSSPSGQKTLL